MYNLRKSEGRGITDLGWLKSLHTFSFAHYLDPTRMGFKSLRVINEDKIAGGTGFDSHPHSDMEIISYVVQGALEHKDSMGTKAIILPGEVQRMSAGTGVLHSELNAQLNEETHFFQIWITPKIKGAKPSYGQKSFENEINTKSLVHVISNDGRDGSIEINQDADMYISRLKKDENFDYIIRPERGLWLQVVKGHIETAGYTLKTGDALSTLDEPLIKLKAREDSEIIIFDLA